MSVAMPTFASIYNDTWARNSHPLCPIELKCEHASKILLHGYLIPVLISVKLYVVYFAILLDSEERSVKAMVKCVEARHSSAPLLACMLHQPMFIICRNLSSFFPPGYIEISDVEFQLLQMRSSTVSNYNQVSFMGMLVRMETTLPAVDEICWWSLCYGSLFPKNLNIEKS